MEDLESALRDAGLEDAAIASFLRESGLTQRFELSEVGVDDLATCLVEACGVKRLKATIIAKAVKRDASSASAKALNTGIFWDVENVALPKGIDPSGASNCLRSVIHERFPSAEVNFKSYYYDSMAGAHVRRGREEISLAGWILNDCPTRNTKETLDKQIIVDAMAFACRGVAQRSPTCVVLISGDGDYAYMLQKLRDLRVTTVVIVPRVSARVLASSADVVLSWKYDILGPTTTAGAEGRGGRGNDDLRPPYVYEAQRAETRYIRPSNASSRHTNPVDSDADEDEEEEKPAAGDDVETIGGAGESCASSSTLHHIIRVATTPHSDGDSDDDASSSESSVDLGQHSTWATLASTQACCDPEWALQPCVFSRPQLVRQVSEGRFDALLSCFFEVSSAMDGGWVEINCLRTVFNRKSGLEHVTMKVQRRQMNSLLAAAKTATLVEFAYLDDTHKIPEPWDPVIVRKKTKRRKSSSSSSSISTSSWKKISLLKAPEGSASRGEKKKKKKKKKKERRDKKTALVRLTEKGTSTLVLHW